MNVDKLPMKLTARRDKSRALKQGRMRDLPAGRVRLV